MDFTEPAGGDPTSARDQEDAYFDDQEPTHAPNGTQDVTTTPALLSKMAGDGDHPVQMVDQNGKGEYDY